jgi:DNA topoisomerase-1
MPKNLVIVESPAKAKTIEKYLGKDFKVESSYGHIRDLVQKDMGIDIANNFAPKYAVSADKKEVVKKLAKLTKEAETVWLASDEDREGEAIAWHLAEALGLNPATTNRIVFSEITKKAIEKAIENPRRINLDLVNAQQARRVLDRLVGFELSPVLWKKVKAGLSAGRVQSVAVRLIVEREQEIKSFETQSYFRVVALFTNNDGKTIKAELNKRFNNEKEAQQFLEQCQKHSFSIDSIETKPAKKSPAAPFTTSTLQQEASRKLSFPVGLTMSVAQKLYEAGLITYMRTDSLNLSDEASSAAKAEITSAYGAEYSKPRKFSTKSKGAQEAHEAIRPTYMNRHSAGGNDAQKRLYDLIWKRTVASQMAEAQLERTTLKIATPQEKLEFVAKGEVIKFEGFLKVYLEGNDDDEDADETKDMLPLSKKGDSLSVDEISATQRFTKHPARYTEASLVKKLEELGIGRPSTYAPTISTIQKRQYVEKSELTGRQRDYVQLQLSNDSITNNTLTETTGADKNKLIPTDIGTVVNGFLVEHFQNILDYNFTARVEQQFDEIAQGQEEWANMIDNFYSDFHPHLKKVEENSERATGERHLGEHPKDGKQVIARIGRYGPMVQIGKTEDEDKPKFASLRKGQHIDSITLEEALELFKLPRDLGEFKGEKIEANIGRFGPYVRYKSTFASIKEEDGDDPMTIELDRAIEIMEAKLKADAEKFIATFEDEKPVIQVLNGRYGPYIKSGRRNFKIPKDVEDPKTLTREDCLAIMEEAGKTKKAAPKRKAKLKK